MNSLPYRQVHLDFHTSEAIPDVAADFDPEQFAATLASAHVNSINIFARCHHGWIYYDTKAFPERRHPSLHRNLLPEQIAACHRRGIKVPIYITVQWDHFTAVEHPEWLVTDDKGAPSGQNWYAPGFYRRLCLNTPYVDWLKSFVREVLTTMPVDGFWFDIVWASECSCRWCRQGMLAAGLDPADAAVRARYGTQVLHHFTRGMTDFVRQYNRDCLIFYNRGHVGPQTRPMLDAYTHLELESLPSGGWGYLHFPVAMRYARTLGKQNIGMTGKFHTSWGDFHSYKNQPALEFECNHMLALGAQCCVGDQLPPRGRLCPVTYDLVGQVYAQVAPKEPWCVDARPVSEIAVLTPEEFAGDSGHSGLPPAIFGATRMLQEGRHQFDIVDSHSEFGGYRVLVLPDAVPVGTALAAKLEAFVAAGGALLATHRSGLNPAGDAFALPCLGVSLKGDAPYSPDFIVPRGAIGAGLPEIEHVIYLKGLEVRPLPGATVLADVKVPYFNRTWRHFCSHRHTPSAGKVGYPGAVQHGRAIYFAHPLFTQYHKNTPLWCKRLVLNALDLLLPQPLVRVIGPSSLLVTLNEQPAADRWVLHLLHYVPERRGQEIDVIEDVYTLADLPISVRVPRPVKAVTLVPQNEALPFKSVANRLAFTLPRLRGHQMLALTFG